MFVDCEVDGTCVELKTGVLVCGAEVDGTLVDCEVDGTCVELKTNVLVCGADVDGMYVECEVDATSVELLKTGVLVCRPEGVVTFVD